MYQSNINFIFNIRWKTRQITISNPQYISLLINIFSSRRFKSHGLVCCQMVTYSGLCYKNTCTNKLLIFTYVIIFRFLIFPVFWKNWWGKTTLCVKAVLKYQRDSFCIVYRAPLLAKRSPFTIRWYPARFLTREELVTHL